MKMVFAAHVADSPGQQFGKLGLFLLAEAMNNTPFVFQNGIVNAFVAGPALGGDENPFAAAVPLIRAELDEILLFQPG